MAGEGWEGGAFLFPNPYWGDYTRQGSGFGVDADSSSLDPNDQPREGAARLNLRRFALGKSFSRGRAEPGGDLVFRPTISYFPVFLMNTCQAVGASPDTVKGTLSAAGVFGTVAGTAAYTHVRGTLVFMPIMDQLKFGTGTSATPFSRGTLRPFGKITWPAGTGTTSKWGTGAKGGVVGAGTGAVLHGLGAGSVVAAEPFPLTAISYFGREMNDGQFVENAIADSLEMALNVGDNMMWTWRGMGGNYRQAGAALFGTGADQVDVDKVDYAITEQEFAEFECKVDIGGADYDLEGIDFTILNSLNRVGGLGHRFPKKLRVQGDLPMGNLDWELTDLDVLKIYDTAKIEISLYGNKYAAGTWTRDDDTWMKMLIPEAKILDYTREIRGDSPFTVQIPFHAYRSGDNGKEPPFMIAVAGVFDTFGMDNLWDHIVAQV